MLELQLRRCLKPECPKTFRVHEDSETRYCCVEHDPNPPEPPSKGKARLSKELRLKIIESIKSCKERGLGRAEILSELISQGVKTASGATPAAPWLNNFMQFEGLTEKRNSRSRAAPEEDLPPPSSFEPSSSRPGDRLPKIAIAILEDEALDDAEKVGMLTRYAGID